MIFDIIYKIIKPKIESDKESTIQTTIEANINKLIQDLKVSELSNLNLIDPTIKDMLLYLVYKLEDQRNNDLDCLDSLCENLLDKLDSSILTSIDIKKLIDTYKTQIKLKR